MNRQVKTKAMSRAVASEKVEDTAMEVIEAAEDLSMATSSANRRYHRSKLLESARLYARALDALSRVG